MVDVEDYIQWAKSLVDAPVVIQQRVSTTSSELWLLQFESFCSKMEVRLQVYHELAGIFFIFVMNGVMHFSHKTEATEYFIDVKQCVNKVQW